MLIDLGMAQKITKGLVIWGSRPAKFLSVYGTDEISMNFEQALQNIDRIRFDKLVDNLQIEISQPFEERFLTDVQLLPNNITEFEIPTPSIFTRFVIVEITDAIDESEAEGATLNEIALF